MLTHLDENRLEYVSVQCFFHARSHRLLTVNNRWPSEMKCYKNFTEIKYTVDAWCTMHAAAKLKKKWKMSHKKSIQHSIAQ